MATITIIYEFHAFLLFTILYTSTGRSVQLSDTPVLQLADGPIFGSVKEFQGLRYEEYLGIPFAAPPVGQLRFQKPVQVEPWSEPKNCTHYAPHCTDFLANFYPFIGMSGENGEDCLYLNVWIPDGVEANRGRQLPVMVWVYGGGFAIGTGEMYPGYALALHGDMIVVNINYRVGIMGFLSTGDSAAVGNYGMWDMKAALDWVQANIALFNGDPTRVTIFGQSAGARAVGHIMLSPHTQGLFHRVISVSGAACGTSAVTTRGLDFAIMTAQLLNCSTTSTEELVTCLRGIEAKKLDFWSSIGMSITTDDSTDFKPVIDEDFIPRSPRESFEMGIGADTDFMTGFAFHDSAGFVINNPVAFPPLGDKLNDAATNESMWNDAMKQLRWTANGEELFKEIINMYPNLNTDDTLLRTITYTQANTDESYGAYSNFEAVKHASSGGSGRTFQYMFQYRQSFLYGYPEWINGSHMDDIYSFLGEPFMEDYRRVYLRQEFDETDKKVRDLIMDYYTNFAHTGDPNTGPKSPEVYWDEFNPAEQNFLHESNTFQMSSFYEQNTVDRFRFWTEVFPEMIVPLPPPTLQPSAPVSLTSAGIREGVERALQKWRSVFPGQEFWKEIENTVEEFVEDF